MDRRSWLWRTLSAVSAATGTWSRPVADAVPVRRTKPCIDSTPDDEQVAVHVQVLSSGASHSDTLTFYSADVGTTYIIRSESCS